jgi:4-hydroxybenzoate polyprenyltransferase
VYIFVILFKAIRVHQWVKNLLLLLPLVLAHQILNQHAVTFALLAFLSFSFIASSIYLVNDIFDIEADRKHPTKCLRPLASGALSKMTGYVVSVILAIFSLFIAYLINVEYLYTTIIYAGLAIVYSSFLKKIFILDVIILAIFYVIRILAGAMAIDAEITNWLLAFSLFFFLSLALVKRHGEMNDADKKLATGIPGRDYIRDDLSILLIFGPASGFMSVLVLMLYITEQQAMDKYSNPAWLWGVSVILLYWIMRIWFLANRKLIHSDPIVYAIKDWPTYAMTGLSLFLVYLAV